MLTNTGALTGQPSSIDAVAGKRQVETSERPVELVVRSARMENVMQQQKAFKRAASRIASRTTSGVEAREIGRCTVGRLFFETGFLDLLGYGPGAGRTEAYLDEDNAEVRVLSFTGRPIALIEFCSPDEDLDGCTAELAEHARDVIGRADGLAGVSNGRELRLYRMRDGNMRQTPEVFDLAQLSSEQIRALVNYFQHSQVDWSRQLRSPQLW